MKFRHSLGLILALTLVHSASGEPGVSVSGAWIREAPPGVSAMAGYMELRNNTSRTQVLVAAGSSGFESVMIHRTIVKDGMAAMLHMSQVEIKPKASLIFAPGGYHLMLMGPQRVLRASAPVIVNLEFEGGLILPVTFEIKK